MPRLIAKNATITAMSSELSAMAHGSCAAAASLRSAAGAFAFCALMFCASPAASEGWQPAEMHPASATLADVLAAYRNAAGRAVPGYENRRETWTYLNGAHRLPVAVAVRGDDVRVDVTLDGATYSAGRFGGVRWRSDANGIAHRTRSDLQSDAIDRVPDALFGFRPQDCELAGETAPPQAAWVLADRRPGDRVQWLFIDQTSGRLVKTILREGKVVETTTFDHFATVYGVVRPQHWHVSDSNGVDDGIDVTVDSITPVAVPSAAVELPPPSGRRVFAPLDSSRDRFELPAHFFPGGHIAVDVGLAGRQSEFLLDTGTASITLDASAARAFGGVVLQHATIPSITVGALRMENVSVLAVPFAGRVSGILGYDFFFGHVVHIDYRGKRVEVLMGAAAAAPFTDPSVTVLAAGVDEGLPLTQAEIGTASGEFALDTGSPRLYVMQPFVQRNRSEIDTRWTRLAERARMVRYLEGAIEVVPYRAADFRFGPQHYRNVDLGVEVPSSAPDAIEIPFDGIIGTDVLQQFELWFDFDGGRVAMRYTG
jgi:hypothetical protein